MNDRKRIPTNQFIARHPIINWAAGLVFLTIFGFAAVLGVNIITPKTSFISDIVADSEALLYLYRYGLVFVFFLFVMLMIAWVYFSKTTKATVFGLLGIALTGLLIHVLTHNHLQGSALFYIGLPLLLAYVFKNVGSAKTATGGILQGITLVMLLSGPFLQEGFICVVMAAPLFYIIGGIIGLITDNLRKKSISKLQASPILMLVAVMSLEGSHPNLSFNRDHTVRVEQVIVASAEAVAHQLEQPLVLGNDVPTYLKLFPFPTVTKHTGTQLGAETTLHFVYYKHFYFSPKIGDLTYQVSARGDNVIESQVIKDDSYVDTYMDWKTSKVSWQALDAEHTKVIWEISYRRKLDPAWYFGTLEYFTTSLMANALIKYAATPESARG